MRLLLVFDQENLQFFDMEDNFSAYPVNGKIKVPYVYRNASEDIKKIIETIVSEGNFSVGEDELYSGLHFVALENINTTLTKRICDAFNSYLEKDRISAKVFARAAIALKKDDELAKKYGVNYGERNFREISGKIEDGDFSLLGYTLKDEDIKTLIRQIAR